MVSQSVIAAVSHALTVRALSQHCQSCTNMGNSNTVYKFESANFGLNVDFRVRSLKYREGRVSAAIIYTLLSMAMHEDIYNCSF